MKRTARPATTTINGDVVALKIDGAVCGTISDIAAALRCNAEALGTLAGVLSASKVELPALIRVESGVTTINGNARRG
jgi:hypothetical protein